MWSGVLLESVVEPPGAGLLTAGGQWARKNCSRESPTSVPVVDELSGELVVTGGEVAITIAMHDARINLIYRFALVGRTQVSVYRNGDDMIPDFPNAE